MKDGLQVGDIVEGTHGKARVVADFLPSPAAFAYVEPETEKITIVLDKATVAFFKEQAANFSVSYQRMIRELLRGYAELHEQEQDQILELV